MSHLNKVRPIGMRRWLSIAITIGVCSGFAAVLIGNLGIAGGVFVAILSGLTLYIFAPAVPALGLNDHINTGNPDHWG